MHTTTLSAHVEIRSIEARVRKNRLIHQSFCSYIYKHFRTDNNGVATSVKDANHTHAVCKPCDHCEVVVVDL